MNSVPASARSTPAMILIERRFAGTVLAGYGEHLVRADLEAHPGERGHAIVVLADVDGAQQVRAGEPGLVILAVGKRCGHQGAA